MIQKKVHDTFEKLVKSLEMAQEKKTVNNNGNNNRVFFFFFLTKFYPRGQNFTKIIKDNFHLFQKTKF